MRPSTYESLLEGTDIDFVRGEVVGVDEGERIIRVAAGGLGEHRMLPYDRASWRSARRRRVSRVPGAAEHAQPFYTAADATAVRERIKELRRNSERSTPRVAVVGGGYIGVELAANLASALPPSEPLLTLVHRSSELLPEGREHSRSQAERRLRDAGVDVVLRTSVASVGADSLQLLPLDGKTSGDGGGGTRDSGVAAEEAKSSEDTEAPGYSLPVDLTLWTAGSTPAPIVSALGLPLDSSGRIRVDDTLNVCGRPRLYALGDAAAVVDAAGNRAPPTAQAAMQQADYAAWNMRSALRGNTPSLPFRYANLGEMLSLGEDSASVSALGQLVKLSGPLASRRVVYAARMPTIKQAAKVGIVGN